jgi:Na+/phosphate symporter
MVFFLKNFLAPLEGKAYMFASSHKLQAKAKSKAWIAYAITAISEKSNGIIAATQQGTQHPVRLGEAGVSYPRR